MAEYSKFVHLHTHSHYSLLDGTITVPKLISKAKKLRMPAIGLTDHGNMFGVIDFYTEASASGIKPIIGCEFYLAPKSMTDREKSLFHLTVLAKDYNGYQNLIRLSSLAYTKGFYYKPRIDKELLAKYSDGLIGLSGCANGEIALSILNNDIMNAERLSEYFKEIFNKNFYFEVQNNHLPEQIKIIKKLQEISGRLSIPLCATNDVHYLNREDAETHDVLLCIQTGKKTSDTDRLKFRTNEFYFKTEQEMLELFRDCPDAIDNTIKIASECSLVLDFGKTHLPEYKISENYDSYLEKLCYEGLPGRYSKITEEIESRLKYELETIKNMGLSSYFLIVADFIKYAKNNGIPVGPGRGSSAGSIVAYVLGITDLDPLKYNLLFERFLNPERKEMPDIDIDFSDSRREEVLEYVREKYGRDRVCHIITFGTMKSRVVVRDVARAIGIPLLEADRIAKLIPFGTELKTALETVPILSLEIKKLKEGEKLLKHSLALEGIIRHASTHAAGVVIANKELTEYTPLYVDPKKPDVVSTQYEMQWIKKIGLLKIDFLGLKTLTVIDKVKQKIEESGNQIEDFKTDFNNKKTYELIQQAKTVGVFQLESPGMQDILRRTKPDKFEDLIAVIALFRPGPMNMIDEFIEKKQHPEKIKYQHPVLKDILEETYGVIVYQEQVMQISQAVAGFTLAQADILRKSMGEKDIDIMKKQRNNFVSGAEKKGFKRRIAGKIFDLIAEFAKYGFNKSHSTVYACLAYQTAYLKANYPEEYLSALLSCEIGTSDNKIPVYINECRDMNIPVLRPDINYSDVLFEIEKQQGRKAIRVGLAAIKNVGLKAAEEIVKIRNNGGNFDSFLNFNSRVDSRIANKRVIEALIKAGAFDSFSVSRLELLKILNQGIKPMDNQLQLFEKPTPVLSKEELSEGQILIFEKEVLGFYLSGNPLEKYSDEIKKYRCINLKEIIKSKDGDIVNLAGYIIKIKNIKTRQNKPMAVIIFEVIDGRIEITLLPDIFSKYEKYLLTDLPLIIKGKVRTTDEQDVVKVDGQEIVSLREAKEKLVSKVHIKMNISQFDVELLERLRTVLLNYQGNVPVVLHLNKSSKDEFVIKVSDAITVKPDDNLASDVTKFPGIDSIWYEY